MTEQSIKAFIDVLKNMDSVDSLNVYEGKNQDWLIYYTLSGFLEDLYFSLYFMKHVSDKIAVVEICGTTDCESTVIGLLKENGFQVN